MHTRESRVPDIAYFFIMMDVKGKQNECAKYACEYSQVSPCQMLLIILYQRGLWLSRNPEEPEIYLWHEDLVDK